MITDHEYIAFSTRDGTRACRYCFGRQNEHAFGIDECPGHDRGGTREPCCQRTGEYNGFGSDSPLSFSCARGCSCHD